MRSFFSLRKSITKPVISRSTQLTVDSLTVLVKRSARRKKSIALKIETNGAVVILAPMQTSDASIRSLIQRRKSWINEKRIALKVELTPPRQYQTGETLLLLGQPLQLQAEVAKSASIKHLDTTLYLKYLATDSQTKRLQRVSRWYRQKAKSYLSSRAEEISLSLQANHTSIQIKQYKARWGSCTQKGLIQLNWRLIMAPPAVIDYVIIHELCHLKHFNHSKAFWLVVEQACPDYKQHKHWLKTHQAQLTLA